jgi:Mce-associated membrane protein
MPRKIAGQRRRERPITLGEQADVEEVEAEAEEVEIEEKEEASPVVEPDAPAATTRGLSFVLTVGLSVVIVLVLALAGVLGVKAWRGQQAEEARGQAVNAGRQAAETALSYDYRTLDKSFAAARATMTPEFAGKFDETAKVAGELATKTKATVRAEVREVGVRDGDANRVTLVIFVNQTTTSTITQGKPRVDLNRTRFTMVRNGSRWLVQEIAGL